MTKDDLMKYCDRNGVRTKEPFSHGDFTYATNGHLCVRISRLSDVPECDAAPPIDLINKYFDLSVESLDYIFLPEITPPEKKPCMECGGKGKDYSCPECDGDGSVGWDTDYNRYEVTCKLCKGERIITDICPVCDGAGHYCVLERYQIGTQFYDKRYLLMIHDLPDVRFAAGGDPFPQPGLFLFSGGAGLLMPMLPPDF